MTLQGLSLRADLAFPPLFTRIAVLHRGSDFNLKVLIIKHDKYR